MNPKRILSNNLQYFLGRKGITQTQMARDLNYPEMTVSNWLNEKTYPRIDKIQEMSDYFGVSRSDLTELKKPESNSTSAQYDFIPEHISAGPTMVAESMTKYETITIPDNLMGKWAGNRQVKIMRVNGESMNNVIPHDSIIAIKEVDVSNLKDGDIVVYRNDDYEYAVKRFYRSNDLIIFRPDSNQKIFTDQVYNINDVESLKIKGKVVLYIVELD